MPAWRIRSNLPHSRLLVDTAPISSHSLDRGKGSNVAQLVPRRCNRAGVSREDPGQLRELIGASHRTTPMIWTSEWKSGNASGAVLIYLAKGNNHDSASDRGACGGHNSLPDFAHRLPPASRRSEHSVSWRFNHRKLALPRRRFWRAREHYRSDAESIRSPRPRPRLHHGGHPGRHKRRSSRHRAENHNPES